MVGSLGFVDSQGFGFDIEGCGCQTGDYFVVDNVGFVGKTPFALRIAVVVLHIEAAADNRIAAYCGSIDECSFVEVVRRIVVGVVVVVVVL